MFYIEKTFLPRPKPGRSESGYQIRDGVGGEEGREQTDKQEEANHTSPCPLSHCKSPAQSGPKLGRGENFTLNQVWSFITILERVSKTLN